MKIPLTLLIIVVTIGGFFVFKTATTISVMGISERSFWEEVSSLFVRDDNNDRLDILLLGIRGKDDPNGGLLADGIMLLSFEKNKKMASLISIPRDLYVEIPDLQNDDGKEKLNFANAYGEAKKRGGGLLLTKALVSNITGLNIDYAVSVDFYAFKEIIDWLGGITITRDTLFREHLQWVGEGKEGKLYWAKENSGWTFLIPKGENFLDGEAALYYIRSRFSTSDFDRSRRQQQVLLAMKDKAMTLGIISSPSKILEMLDILKKNIQTDMSIGDIKNLFLSGDELKNIKVVKNTVIDSSDSGLLYESYNERKEFILLPKSNDWSGIKDLAGNVFTQK